MIYNTINECSYLRNCIIMLTLIHTPVLNVYTTNTATFPLYTYIKLVFKQADFVILSQLKDY